LRTRRPTGSPTSASPTTATTSSSPHGTRSVSGGQPSRLPSRSPARPY
jgi:hypothetical protein